MVEATAAVEDVDCDQAHAVAVVVHFLAGKSELFRLSPKMDIRYLKRCVNARMGVSPGSQQLYTANGENEIPDSVLMSSISTMPDELQMFIIVISAGPLTCEQCSSGFKTYSELFAHKAQCSYGYTNKWWKTVGKIRHTHSEDLA